ncbi:hypothetical protein E4U42_004061 [Claviceps africana]|uniref:Voltage-gated hydrogen channel 1 n=1 Tax=Claviceps africana TaxID=83212 RepID=A0A8K0J852_9HYPO|nr:hypothetical protein E4U42_004061 [Claviceps africana]
MSDAATPLLPPPPDATISGLQPGTTRRLLHHLHRVRRRGRVLLSSRRKHFLVMSMVALDVTALLANIFIQLIACEMHQRDEPWVRALTGSLETLGLVLSSLFMVELGGCLFSFGLSYLASWFHLFDALVIVASFVIDVASQGLTESIGSLVVVLRLWRLARISEEVVMGATERLDLMEQHLQDLERENATLKRRLHVEEQEEEYSGYE